MSEATFAFKRVERPNVRANTSVQPLNCPLRSFAQECLQRMKQHLYRVKVRMRWRAKKRDSALRLPGSRRLRSAETISSSVKSGLMSARICCEYISNGEGLPPRGVGSQSRPCKSL